MDVFSHRDARSPGEVSAITKLDPVSEGTSSNERIGTGITIREYLTLTHGDACYDVNDRSRWFPFGVLHVEDPVLQKETLRALLVDGWAIAIEPLDESAKVPGSMPVVAVTPSGHLGKAQVEFIDATTMQLRLWETSVTDVLPAALRIAKKRGKVYRINLPFHNEMRAMADDTTLPAKLSEASRMLCRTRSDRNMLEDNTEDSE